MAGKDKKTLITLGSKVDDFTIYHADKIWSRYSSDKVDIGQQLARVIRTIDKTFPLNTDLRALSVGSSDDPQFRVLETAFRGGLYLFDIDEEALEKVKERLDRQHTTHVKTILDDYTKAFLDKETTKKFLKQKLGGKKVHLVTIHHSLYYCDEKFWHIMIDNIYREILAAQGAIHIVLMASKDKDAYTTTWLYNHFVGKYYGLKNDQNILELKKELAKMNAFKKAQLLLRTNKVQFSIDNFQKFMAVIWMILLYPNVHSYTKDQKKEITTFVYNKFWKRKHPLMQSQNHFVIYKGIKGKGLV